MNALNRSKVDSDSLRTYHLQIDDVEKTGKIDKAQNFMSNEMRIMVVSEIVGTVDM